MNVQPTVDKVDICCLASPFFFGEGGLTPTTYIICSTAKSASGTDFLIGQKLKKALSGIFSHLLKLTSLKVKKQTNKNKIRFKAFSR